MLLVRLMVRETPAVRQLQILFVDSDPQAQEKIRQALEKAFAVRCVASLVEARRSLVERPPDALICEAALGTENGLELCQFVRSHSTLSHLPVMVLTSQMTLQDKVAGFLAGADDYVVKPFDARHLVARIRLLLRIKHLELRDNAAQP